MSDENVVHCIASAGTLRQYIDTLTPLVDEAKLYMGDEGWHVSAVDPADVACIQHCDLPPRAFEDYDSPGSVTVGLNLNRFEELFGAADDDDLVEVSVNMETHHVELSYHKYGQTSASMALIDPASIRQEPDQTDLDLPNEVVLEGGALSHAVANADLVGDHLWIRGDEDEREFVIGSEGDTDDGAVSFDDEDIIDASVDETAESLFSIDYMKAVTAPIPDDAEVRVVFGDEWPVLVYWHGPDGMLDVHQMVAPRIQSE